MRSSGIKSYTQASSRAVIDAMLGAFMAGLGGAILWFNRGKPYAFGVVVAIAFCVGGGLLLGAMRTRFTVDPARHLCMRETQLFRVTVARRVWNFDELDAVVLRVAPRGRGELFAAVIYLLPRNGEPAIEMNVHSMRRLSDGLPLAALEQAREIARMTGLPLHHGDRA